ncbi:hypothetical protein [Halegenticoccus soli]|uniref:hypothetical protein n=1 Tax=Halegenticoccus soli TaxID=1985678 RepID=UPI000C6CB8FB|nr:hypothetical protein [Halegenticoccus soli]
MSDPYDLDLGANWRVRVGDGRVDYVDDSSGVRVAITEFQRHLQVYWWVDVYTREDGTWIGREVGLGDSYRDPESAAEAAQSVVDAVCRGDDLAGVEEE